MTQASGNVTLLMPIFNEAADLSDVLESLRAQTFVHSRIFVVLVDGGSTDGSRAIVKQWLDRGDIDGIVLDNPRRTIPSSLNLGIAAARPGDIIVRLDAHTTYEPTYVAQIVAAFDRLAADVGCVGGAVIPAREDRFDHALVAALYTNPMGLGGADFRHAREPRFVRSVYLGAWRPGVLEHVGGYDEAWHANEDGELAARMRRAGYRTYWLPLRSAYRVKRGPISVIRQWFSYGYWRAQTLRRHPGELRVRHIVPPLAFFAAFLLACSPLHALIGVLFALYAFGIFRLRAPGERFEITIASIGFFAACQVAWSLGLTRGTLDPNAKLARRIPQMFGIGMLLIALAPAIGGGSQSITHVKTFAEIGPERSARDTANYDYGILASYAQAALWVSWAATDDRYARQLRMLGIKTVFYVDPHRLSPSGFPMAQTIPSDETAYYHSCDGTRVHTSYNGRSTQYVGNPASPALNAFFDRYVREHARVGDEPNYDAVWEDDAGPLSEFYQAFVEPLPGCWYPGDVAYMRELSAFQRHSPLPILMENLANWHGAHPSKAIDLLDNPNVIGGLLEFCFSATSHARAKESGTAWLVQQETALRVIAEEHKQFFCFNYLDGGDDAASIDRRGYVFASFLLSYDPTLSVLAEQVATPSGVSVEPEAAFVPLQPVVPTPRDPSALRTQHGAYAREFRACSIHGTPVGRCAIVVNPSAFGMAAFPYPGKYKHTLRIEGRGAIEGIDTGRITIDPAAPPAALPPRGWVIAIS